MNKNIILAFASVAILVLGGLVFFAGDKDTAEQSQSTVFTGIEEVDSYLEPAERGEALDATGQDEVQLTIDDFVFDQQVVRVSQGTKVTWVNEGKIRHNVVSWEGSPNKGLSSELLGNGESYSYTFDEVGTFVYICTPHPLQMRAVVEVVEG